MLCGTEPGALSPVWDQKPRLFSVTHHLLSLSSLFFFPPTFIKVWFFVFWANNLQYKEPQELHCSQQVNSMAKAKRSAGIPGGP